MSSPDDGADGFTDERLLELTEIIRGLHGQMDELSADARRYRLLRSTIRNHGLAERLFDLAATVAQVWTPDALDDVLDRLRAECEQEAAARIAGRPGPV